MGERCAHEHALCSCSLGLLYLAQGDRHAADPLLHDAVAAADAMLAPARQLAQADLPLHPDEKRPLARLLMAIAAAAAEWGGGKAAVVAAEIKALCACGGGRMGGRGRRGGVGGDAMPDWPAPDVSTPREDLYEAIDLGALLSQTAKLGTHQLCACWLERWCP